MDNRGAVRDHYNHHANANPNFNKALAVRQQGKAAPLKDFHNHIKRLMIKRFAANCPLLLDFCCGRGGDIMKWFAFGVQYAKGLDISDAEVYEASQRFAEQKRKPDFARKPLQCEFDVCAQLGEKEWSDGRMYDVVTCMFAMHYFFEREHSLKVFLHNVALNLKPGGIFMGTIPCGKRVLQLLGGKDAFQSKMLRLEKKWQGDEHERTCFSLGYTCAITDTVTEGRGDSSGSQEYLTFMRPVEGILASHGIFPVRRYGDRALEDCFDPADRDEILKRFLPRFRDAEPSLEAASAMFGAFVFRKADNAPPPAKLLAVSPVAPAAGHAQHGGHGEDGAPPAKRSRQGGADAGQGQQGSPEPEDGYA